MKEEIIELDAKVMQSLVIFLRSWKEMLTFEYQICTPQHIK